MILLTVHRLAGGKKYIVGGILFKFALDQEIEPGLWMYGGDRPRDDLAMISAGKELLGLSCCATVPQLLLNIPLTCVINYLGYRLVCMAWLPINRNTICYGSMDGGITVHRDVQEVNEAMNKIGEYWNLASHRIGSSPYYLHTAGDVEVHRGTDGNFYIVDFGRFAPPEAPLSKEQWEKEPRSVYYKLLRQELVLSYPEPLSPDVFTGWGAYDSHRKELETRVINCTKELYDSVIPAFAKEFQERELSFFRKLCADPNMKFGRHELALELTRTDMTYLLHFVGINLRHLGRIRAKIKSDHHRKFILCHCVSRLVKNILRAKMREKTRQLQGSPSEIPFRELVIEMIYTCFGPETEEKVCEFWIHVRKCGVEKFAEFLSEEELRMLDENPVQLRDWMEDRVFATLLLRDIGVEMEEQAHSHLIDSPRSGSLVLSDIKCIRPICKQTYIASTCDGLLATRQASKVKDRDSKIRVLIRAVGSLAFALSHSPMCPYLTREYAHTVKELALLKEQPCRSRLLALALDKIHNSLVLRPTRKGLDYAKEILLLCDPSVPSICNTVIAIRQLTESLENIPIPEDVCSFSEAASCQEVNMCAREHQEFRARLAANRKDQMGLWKDSSILHL